MAKSYREYCLETYFADDWDLISFEECDCYRFEDNQNKKLVIDYNNSLLYIGTDENLDSYSFDSPEAGALAEKINPDDYEYNPDDPISAIRDGNAIERCHCYRCPFFDDCEMWDDDVNEWDAEKQEESDELFMRFSNL